MQPTVSIDRQELQAFERTIQRTAEQGKKSLSGAMIQAAVFASQSAAGSVYGQTNSGRFRKFGKKNRKSRRLKKLAPRRDKKGRFLSDDQYAGRPWWSVGQVEIWSKGVSQVAHFRTDAAFQKAKLVPRRGLAGNVWRAAGAVKAQGIEGIFQRALSASSDQRLIGSYSSNKVTKTSGMISGISMSNSLNYIQKVAPNSAREGVATARRKMDGILKRKLASKIEKSFQQRGAL